MDEKQTEKLIMNYNFFRVWFLRQQTFFETEYKV